MTFLHKKSMRAFTIATSAFALIALSGCASLLSSVVPEPAPANTVYRLSASTQDTVVTPTADAIVLRVDRPTVPRPLAGSEITVSPSGDRILAASGAEWAEKVPDLIQGSIMDVFSSRPNIIGVLPVSGARTELRIHLSVTRQRLPMRRAAISSAASIFVGLNARVITVYLKSYVRRIWLMPPRLTVLQTGLLK